MFSANDTIANTILNLHSAHTTNTQAFSAREFFAHVKDILGSFWPGSYLIVPREISSFRRSDNNSSRKIARLAPVIIR